MILLYLAFLTFCAGIMSEPPKRNSTRERKPNRFLQLDDADPPNPSASRLSEHKDSKPAPETTQTARLLLRFVTTSNKKVCMDPRREGHYDELKLGIPIDAHILTHLAEEDPAKRTSGTGAQGNLRADLRRAMQEATPCRSAKGSDRKQQSSARGGSSASADADVEEQKRFCLETQASNGLGMRVAKDGQRKKEEGPQGGQRESSKPYKKLFSRQCYHIAISYHIHIKKAPPGQPIPDPIAPARRMQELLYGGNRNNSPE